MNLRDPTSGQTRRASRHEAQPAETQLLAHILHDDVSRKSTGPTPESHTLQLR
jgi:hypothetical protein